jgi:recombination protein RecA
MDKIRIFGINMKRKIEQKKIVKDIVKTSKSRPEKVTSSKTQTLIPSGADVFDLTLGGGFPTGKIVNVVGDKSTGKTLMVSELISTAKKTYGKKLKWFYDDAEVGYNFNSSVLYGFEILPEDGYSSDTIEDFDFNLGEQLEKIKEGEYLIYVLDCFDSLSSEAEIERYEEERKAREKGKKLEKGSYKLEKQKALNLFFRIMKKKIKNKNCLLVILSQVRTKINVLFGEKYYRTGDKALDHYSSLIIWLAEAEKQKKKNRVTGITIKVNVKKNKVGKPFRVCYLEILFDYGVDNLTSNLMFLYDLKTETGKNKKNMENLEWDGEEYKILKDLVEHIEKNNLEEELKSRVIKKWNDIEEAISSKDRKAKW